jgi:NTP pyrophosphatase (non-canonical NTP hydrolase)|nr:MAG TPA: nucleoside triphosphate pyrophosphohydrolase [Caudoviricetes sp.]
MNFETGDWMPGGSDMEQRQSDAEDMNRIINQKLGARERLEVLAEEAAELSQAALKMIRAYRMGGAVNPTPLTPEEALENLFEEVADVELAIESLGLYYMNRGKIEKTKEEKRKRWAERLKGAERNE